MAVAICSEVKRMEPATRTESKRAVPGRVFCEEAVRRDADNGVNAVVNRRHAQMSGRSLWKMCLPHHRSNSRTLKREGEPTNCITRGKTVASGWLFHYSTVTDFARLRGWSTSQPRRTAMW